MEFNGTREHCLAEISWCLDRSLCYKQQIQNTKMKVATRNNVLTKIVTSKWGANPSSTRTTALALSYSTAEYVTPVWARSAHAHNLDPGLNQECRSVAGFLKPISLEELYLVSGIAPPQPGSPTSSLFGHIPAIKLLKYRHCFLPGVQPANFTAKVIRCSKWRKRLHNKPHIGIINLHEEMAKGYDSPWTMWKCLNGLRMGYTFSKTQRKKWKFYTGNTTCYSAPKLHIPTLWMTSFRSMM